MKDKIVLNSAEQRRVLVLNQLEAGVLSPTQAGQLLGLAERQLRRLRARYRQEGAGALAHGNRGRRPVNAVDPDLAQRVIELARTTYQGFNRHHLTEMLADGGKFLRGWQRKAREHVTRRPALETSRRTRQPRQGTRAGQESHPQAEIGRVSQLKSAGVANDGVREVPGAGL